jgi:hypothetical protein
MTDNVKPREGGKYSLYCYDCDTWVPNTANHEMRKEGVIAHSHICSKHEKHPNKDEYYLSKIRRLQSENTRLKAELDKAVEDLRRCRRNKCDYCYYSNKNKNTPCRDCQSPISNCGDRWKWRGLVDKTSTVLLPDIDVEVEVHELPVECALPQTVIEKIKEKFSYDKLKEDKI